jgi:Flp pilus assembly protein TadG
MLIHSFTFSCRRRGRSIPIRSRRGNFVVLTAFLLIGMTGLISLSVEVGYMLVVRTELQRAADAAALAGALELVGDPSDPDRWDNVRQAAADFVALNPILGRSIAIDLNAANDQSGEILIGTADNWSERPVSLDTSDPSRFNAVQVRVQHSSVQNGEVGLFFGRLLGQKSFAAGATATAALRRGIEGFRRPPRPGNLPFLPVALDANVWQELMDDNVREDSFSWDETAGEVVAGPDNLYEVELYAERNGSAGNFGTVRVGRANNSTSHLSDQILNGLSDEDLDYHGGELGLDDNGQLSLSGEPGISASIRRDFEQIIGQPRVIPIFDQVVDGGATAVYRIVKFVGIRVLNVDLNGSHLRITVQPADISIRGGIPGEDEVTSDYLYTAVQLIR